MAPEPTPKPSPGSQQRTVQINDNSSPLQSHLGVFIIAVVVVGFGGCVLWCDTKLG